MSTSWINASIDESINIFEIRSHTETLAVSDPIEYALEPHLTSAEFIDVLRRSTLDQRRPVDDLKTISGMLEHADVIVTARTADGTLVGVSRAITDFSYCTYLSDLCVDTAYQGQGIGRTLIERTREMAGNHVRLILLSAPDAAAYYPHIGMQQHPSCWMIDPDK